MLMPIIHAPQSLESIRFSVDRPRAVPLALSDALTSLQRFSTSEGLSGGWAINTHQMSFTDINATPEF